LPLSPEESALARTLVARSLVKREAILRCADALDRLRSRGQRAELPALLIAWKLVTPADVEAARRAAALGETASGPEVPSRSPIPGAPSTIGPYVLRGVIGSGGMATVYDAEDPALGRPVALKVVQIAGGNQRAVERMRREAKALASFRHPHIVAVHATGETRDFFWIALERVRGRSLAERLVEEPRLAPRDAAALVGKVARALQAAHAVRILHRDVKPANIIVDEAGEPRLVDFGIALDLADDSKRITRDDMIVGTPAYLAPEQLDAREATELTDLWSLGVTLHEVLAGELPFQGDTTQQLFGQIIKGDPPPIPRVPADLQVICRKTLEKEARDRYGSAAALAQDLEAFARGDPIAARPPSVVARFARFARRRRGALAAVAFLVAAVGGGGAWARSLRARSDEETRLAAARPYEEPLAAARAAEASGQYASALEGYAKALLARSGDPVALSGRGRVEEALGDFAAAERTLRPALARVETSLPTAEAAATLGAFARALIDRGTIVSDVPASKVIEEARGAAARGVALAKDDPLLVATLARVEAAAGHAAEARALMVRVPPAGEAAAEAALGAAILARKEEDWKGFAAHGHEAAKGSPHARVLAAWTLEVAGEDVAALDLLEAVQRDQPANASIHLALAHVCAQELHFEDAEREATAASGLGSPDPALDARLAKAIGRDRVLDSVRAMVDRAACLVGHNDPRDAEQALELARSAQQTPPESRGAVSDIDIFQVGARALLAAGDPEKALKVVDVALEQAGEVHSLRRVRMDVLMALKRDQEALADADAALAAAPADHQAMKGKLRALVQLGRIDDALRAADAFVEVRPKGDIAATTLLMYVGIEAGQYARAVAALERTRERPAWLATFESIARRLIPDPPPSPRLELPPSEDWGDPPAGSWSMTFGGGRSMAAMERDPRRRIYGNGSTRITSFKGGEAPAALVANGAAGFDASRGLVFWVHAEALDSPVPYSGSVSLTITFHDGQDREQTLHADGLGVARPGWQRVRAEAGEIWKRGGAADADVAHATEIDFNFEGIAPAGALIWIDGLGPG
jgi:tetratricopeptide (TPR) repeat protein